MPKPLRVCRESVKAPRAGPSAVQSIPQQAVLSMCLSRIAMQIHFRVTQSSARVGGVGGERCLGC